ncbi:hypothetical protein EV421DRAFT_366398 [Armillaria borealis]|uniref:Uncharacterized protein n=1 Tax=Armillaria borealis TaxID=47425 RepID=A0AA39MST1_9AGAR|nr:hypothetical protein EV421DRAFT_366398 [Armillaria borealis]
MAKNMRVTEGFARLVLCVGTLGSVATGRLVWKPWKSMWRIRLLRVSAIHVSGRRTNICATFHVRIETRDLLRKVNAKFSHYSGPFSSCTSENRRRPIQRINTIFFNINMVRRQ